MTKNSNSTTSLASMLIDPLDISVDPNTMTVGDLRDLLARYPADAPLGLGFFESDNKRCKAPDLYPFTRLAFGAVPAQDVIRTNEGDQSQIEAVVFMFDSGVTGEEFDGPHDGDRDHNSAIIEHAAAEAPKPSRRRKPTAAVQAAMATPNSNVVALMPPTPRRK